MPIVDRKEMMVNKCASTGEHNLQVERVSVAALVADPANARKHSAKNLEAIKGSLARFGQQKPIVVGRNSVVLAGNGTLEAARQLGWETIEIVRTELDGTDATAFAIADNRTGELAEWDAGVLSETLKSLQEMDFDLGSIGFDAKDLGAMIASPEPSEGLTDPDAVPEQVETRCKPGDLWVLGNHRLLCGDSTNVQHVERLMEGEKADMVFTDPPYGIGIDGQKQSIASNPKHNRKGHEFRGWDDDRPDKGLFNYILALDVPAVIFGGNYFADMLPASRGWLYWGKGQDGALTSSDGELAWTNLTKPLRAVTVNRGTLQGSVHPTQKPVEVVEFCLDYVGEANKVLDLFLGSGSTLIACEKTGRRCFGMEIDPKYCDVILARWETFTGKTASLAAGEEQADG